MSIKEIPTGILPEEIVDTLPEKGEENKVYRRLVKDEALREMQITDDFVWYANEWHDFSFDARIYGAYFERYQQSVIETIAELEQRIEALEGGSNKVLFEGDNIELTESMSQIEKVFDVHNDILVTDKSELTVTLSDMTLDGVPLDNQTDTVPLEGIKSWDYQCGIIYDEAFGIGSYLNIGTKPLNSVATKVTLAFMASSEDFTPRKLNIGYIKIEVV